MSSKVNSALFELIKSMSKSEKRYFKLMSSRHTIGDENNYVRLFDYLGKQEEYDEEAIFRAFKGEAFLNRFSITKKRLYDHVLSSLDSFHQSGSIEAQLYKQLHAADILFDKSLYDQCRRLLRSAEKLAEKNELNGIQLQISNKQKRLMETIGYLDMSPEQMDEIEQADKQRIQAVSTYQDLWMIKSRVFAQLSKKGVARSQAEIEEYKIICLPVLECVLTKNATEKSTYLYHHILSAYYYAIGELRLSLDHLKINLEAMDEKRLERHQEANKYVSALTNVIYIADKLGDHRESLIYLAKLKTFAATVESNEDLAIKLFSSISSIELSMHLRKGDFKQAIPAGQMIEERLKALADKVSPVRKAFLEFKIAVAHIGIGDYSQALKWINAILNDTRLDKTEDIIGFTQLLDLIVHIELDHVKLLPYSLKSTQRFFKTRNRMYSFERILLNAINKLIKLENPTDRFDLWEELNAELAKITNDDVFESVALDYFDFQSWAESKLKGKSFDLIVREKYNNRIREAS